MKNFPFLSTLLLLSFPALAQQTWTNSYFPFNRFNANPAFTALHEKLQVDALYGAYPLYMAGFVREYTLNAQYSLPSTRSGLGISMYDQMLGEGNLYRFSANISYRYRHFVGESHKYQLSYGLAATHLLIDPDAYYFYGVTPTLGFTNAGLGIAFSEVNNKLYAGASAPIIVSIPNKNSKNYRLGRIYIFNAGYRFDIHQWSISTHLMAAVDKFDTSISLATQIQHKWLNIGIGGSRSNQASDVFISAQATIKKHFTIGYSYQYSLSSIQTSYMTIAKSMLILSYRRK